MNKFVQNNNGTKKNRPIKRKAINERRERVSQDVQLGPVDFDPGKFVIPSVRQVATAVRVSNTHSKFTYGGRIRQGHGMPIYGVSFNWTLKPGEPLIFASVGSYLVSIYECSKSKPFTLGNSKSSSESKLKSKENVPHDEHEIVSESESPFKRLLVFADPDKKEEFYTCAWSMDSAGNPYLATAGLRGIIRILSPVDGNCVKSFIGHGGPINYITFHPKDVNLLLSCSQDHSLRLWNIENDHCIAIFSGDEGHRDEVLHASFDLLGSRIVSCGMDHSLKVWMLDVAEVKAAIVKSHTWEAKGFVNGRLICKPFPTHRQQYPQFSTRNIHNNYVDCVSWFGEFIISKSCKRNKIICWKGGDAFQDWSDVVAQKIEETTVIREWKIENCDPWFIRFGLDFAKKRLALGNEIGKTYIYDMKREGMKSEPDEVLSHPKCTSLIRQTAWSRDGNVLVCVCDDSSIWRWDYKY